MMPKGVRYTGARQRGIANGSGLYSWASSSPITTLRIVWSPLSCTRERTQGRPEVPAPAAPPSSLGPSGRPPGLARIGRRRGVLGGELRQFGRVLACGFGQEPCHGQV